MALSINTNVSSLFAQQYLAHNQSNLENTLMKLSSSRRINHASDDPAGMAIASGMQSTIAGLNTGAANAMNGVALVETATGAMTQILNNLQTMKNLVTQALNGTNSSSDLADLNAQYQQLLTQIGSITTNASFNGVALLDGTNGSISIQTGASASNTLSITLVNTTTSSLGIASTSITTSGNASTALSSLTTAITTVTTGLATLGASQAGLNAVIANNQTYSANLQTAMSNIMDTDYAAETSNLAKYQILNQSNIAMLSQANSVPQMVMKLLQ